MDTGRMQPAGQYQLNKQSPSLAWGFPGRRTERKKWSEWKAEKQGNVPVSRRRPRRCNPSCRSSDGACLLPKLHCAQQLLLRSDAGGDPCSEIVVCAVSVSLAIALKKTAVAASTSSRHDIMLGKSLPVCSLLWLDGFSSGRFAANVCRQLRPAILPWPAAVRTARHSKPRKDVFFLLPTSCRGSRRRRQLLPLPLRLRLLLLLLGFLRLLLSLPLLLLLLLL